MWFLFCQKKVFLDEIRFYRAIYNNASFQELNNIRLTQFCFKW